LSAAAAENLCARRAGRRKHKLPPTSVVHIILQSYFMTPALPDAEVLFAALVGQLNRIHADTALIASTPARLARRTAHAAL